MKYLYIISFITLVNGNPLSTTENNSLVDTDEVVRLSDSEEVVQRSIIVEEREKWPNAIVPYEVDSSFNSFNRLKLQKAIKLFQEVSCVRFVPHTNEVNYVRFVPKEYGCESWVGMRGGMQEVWFADECFTAKHHRGSVVHEMMHVLGFVHEQMRDDRDCYVKITGVGKTLRDFAMLYNTDTTWIYDHQSLMHYKERENFKGRHGERLGNFAGTATFWDRMKINYLYCDQPHFCRVYPETCKEDELNERFCRVNQP